jgi:cellulose biosynthesis protein BcsQ
VADDADVLCAFAGVDHRGYRSFPRTLKSEQEEKALVIEDNGPRLLSAQHSVSSEQNSNRIGQRSTGWRALHSLFEDRSKLSGESADLNALGRVLPFGTLTVIPGAGGVGVTTLLATLARILSIRRQSVLLVDGAAQSLLPFHFGGTNEIAGRCTFLTPRGSDEGVVSVFSCAAEGSQIETQQIWRDVRESGAGAGHVLMDLWTHVDHPGREVIHAESTCIVVLTPDVRSVVKLRQIEKTFCGGPQTRRPYYILNRFDQSVSLHNEFQRFFLSQVGERLRRGTIRRSDEVNYALAEGVTVVDYAPNSAIAGDFHRVADWLQAVERAIPKASPGLIEISGSEGERFGRP